MKLSFAIYFHICGKYLKIKNKKNNLSLHFSFSSIARGNVYVTAVTGLSNSFNWDEYVQHWRFQNSPSWYGYQEDMASGGYDWNDYYGLRMEAIFVAPATGYYYFRIYCDDMCMFYLGVDATQSNKRVINDFRGENEATGYMQFMYKSFLYIFFNFPI